MIDMRLDFVEVELGKRPWFAGESSRPPTS
jgi:hypothetical protein